MAVHRRMSNVVLEDAGVYIKRQSYIGHSMDRRLEQRIWGLQGFRSIIDIDITKGRERERERYTHTETDTIVDAYEEV